MSQARKATSGARILVVDDHPVVRGGLVGLINARNGWKVVGEASGAEEAVDMARTLEPSLIIVDVQMPGSNGIELVKTFRAQQPNVAVLVLSMHDEAVYAQRALRAGARGYLMKAEASARIIQAMEQVLRGDIYLSDRMKKVMLTNVADPRQRNRRAVDELSDRELQVFEHLGDGYSTRRIAEELHLSIKTIESYREALKSKLGLKSGADLVQYAIQWSKTATTIEGRTADQSRPS